MILTSELFVVPILLIALITISITSSIVGIKAPIHQYAPIDGLRGLLAMLVFIHHSSMWFMYSHTHQWAYLGPNLFIHFGPTSVMMFFMITSFLFFSKLMDAAAENKMDWLKLYISRILRIVPLYLLAVLILFALVGFATHFSLKESLGNLLLQAGQWVFIMEVDINGFHGTKYVISGVQWSLAYEWLFYCSLTFSGWAFFEIRSSLVTIAWTSIFLIIFALVIYNYYPGNIWKRLSPFAAGFVAALISRNTKAKTIFSSDWLSILSIIIVGFAIQFEPDFWTLLPVSLLFIVIACGNNFFGFLIWKPCRLLGQISYSIYLLHGLLLYTVFHLVLGFGPQAAELSVFIYWFIICVVCIALVIICALTYRYIEKPSIDYVFVVTEKVRNWSRLENKKERLFKERPRLDRSEHK